ncbi:hypothetical protein NA78x_001855 [Anatilimnocola sp. NA78]|uniref:hypothetical protein n=1 Tax=Anatilimnocola sp. NA78 TaxID=3415683 RepID=UPI003CE49B51
MTDLKHLDNRQIRIDVACEGTTKVFRGKGRFVDCDPTLGPVLGVVVEDPTGNFEFLFPVNTWTAEILPDTSGESDFRICLDSVPNSLN